MTTFQSAQHIADTITENCTGKTLVLLSGGSSAKVGIKALQLLTQDVLSNITVALTDERFVPIDSQDSNWDLLLNLGLNDIAVQKVPVLSETNETRELVASKYAQALDSAKNEAEQIVAIFGIGNDNHIAGILPNTVAAQTNNKLVVDYATSTFERITISPAFFELIDFAFLYAEGAEKNTAIQLLHSNLEAVGYPSQLLKRAKSWEVIYNEEGL